MTIAKLLYNPITLVVITILAIVTFIQLDQTTKKSQFSHIQVAEKEKIVQNMADKVSSLEEQFSEVNSDFYKEKVVRDELLLQKENEIILKLPELIQNKKNELNNEVIISNFAQWQALFWQN